MASAKTAPSLVPVKRPIRQLSVLEKLEAIERVHNGESKASVARDIGVPESTLRGWCKSEDKLRNVAQSCGGGGGTPDSQHSGGAAELAELDALVEQGTSGDHPAIKRMRTASDDEKASVAAAAAAASELDDSLWYWLKQEQQQHVSNQLFAAAAADKLAAAAAAAGAAVAAVANGGSGGGVAGGAASAAAPANAGWFWRWYKRYGYTQYPGDPLAALTAAPAPDLRAAGAALNGGGGGTASRSASLLDSVLLNNNNNLAAVAPAFNSNLGNTNTSATTHHDQHNSGASNGTNANGSAGNNNGSSDEDDELDELDEPPATAAEAVTHGEKFLRWLECCSDPSITAMQILQFRYLLNNVRACADRRARQTKTKKARSRRKVWTYHFWTLHTV